VVRGRGTVGGTRAGAARGERRARGFGIAHNLVK